MGESKYGRLIITDTKALPAELTGKMMERPACTGGHLKKKIRDFNRLRTNRPQ